MTWRIDDIDAMIDSRERTVFGGPATGNGRRGNGDSALPFLLHPVHDGGSFVNFADLVDYTGIEKNTLGTGGFPRINVGGYPDVPSMLENRGAIS